MNEKWQNLRKNLVFSLFFSLLVASGIALWLSGASAALVTAVTILCLASGFWITEGLIGVMTGVKKANGTAIGLLFLGKLGWWGLIFWLSRVYPPGMEMPIAIGLGAFLLSLLIVAISHFGLPKISDAKGSGEP